MPEPTAATPASDTTMAGKVAIVTGGSSAIGRAIALRLARSGAAVVVADLQPAPREGGQPTHELITAAGGRAQFVRMDVAQPNGLDPCLELAAEWGGLDVLVNNAGILRAGSFLEFAEADYDAVMNVNVKGAFFMAQAAVRAMVQAERGGVIINLSSIGALQGMPGLAAYSAAKGAIRALTYSLAKELGKHQIRVCALHPGVIDTSMTRVDVPVKDEGVPRGVPLRRRGVPEDVADAAAFLAGDAAAFITGTSLVIDGGQLSIG